MVGGGVWGMEDFEGFVESFGFNVDGDVKVLSRVVVWCDIV